MSIAALAGISGIDTTQGLTNCMDDEDLYTSVVGMFVDQLIDNVTQLNLAYEDQDWDNIGKIAHSIKGAAASVGAFEIQQSSATIEHASKQNDIDVITDNFASFITLISTTSAALKQNL